VSSAGGEKFAVPRGIAPIDIAEGLPFSPERTRFLQQGIGLLQHFLQYLGRLAFQGKAHKVLQWCFMRRNSMRQVECVPCFFPEGRVVLCWTYLRGDKERGVCLHVANYNHWRSGELLQLCASADVYSGDRCDR